MSAKSNVRGHEIYFDGVWRYSDNNEIVSDEQPRPCIYCGKSPTGVGEDYCIRRLGNVVSACCGHGKHNKGYVKFDNGVTIRGYFEVEYN